MPEAYHQADLVFFESYVTNQKIAANDIPEGENEVDIAFRYVRGYYEHGFSLEEMQLIINDAPDIIPGSPDVPSDKYIYQEALNRMLEEG